MQILNVSLKPREIFNSTAWLNFAELIESPKQNLFKNYFYSNTFFLDFTT